MNASEFKTSLALLGLSARHVARELNMSYGAIQKWYEGKASVPEDVAAWLTIKLRCDQENPPPRRA